MNQLFSTLINDVAQVCKFNPTLPEYIALVRLALSRAYYKLVREGKILEAVISNVVIPADPLTTTKFVVLPDDIIEIIEVEFESSLGRRWTLAEYYKERIPPAPVYGKPRAYKLGPPSGAEQNPTLTVEPIGGVVNGEIIYISATVGNPEAIDPDNASFFLNNNNMQMVKDDVIQAILIFQGKLDQASLYQRLLATPIPPTNETPRTTN